MAQLQQPSEHAALVVLPLQQLLGQPRFLLALWIWPNSQLRIWPTSGQLS